ncbi:MAG: class I SAM-dependent methyltransferase [Microthrixaceae bacterium]
MTAQIDETNRAEPTGLLTLARRFLSERDDPEPFYNDLAERALGRFPVPVEGRRIADIACGTGQFTAALERHGARCVAVDLDRADIGAAGARGLAAAWADARRLPLADASVDGVVCSNLLEHTPDPGSALAEIARVLTPGGWAWVSWTLWWSPWGGHAIAPFHLLGPRVGARVRQRLLGPPSGKNLPFERLWPTHAGSVLRLVGQLEQLDLEDCYPRYWPSQRWLMRVPVLREVAAWNAVLVLRRSEPTATAS